MEFIRGEREERKVIRVAKERYAEAKALARQGLGNTTEYASKKGGLVKDTLIQGAQTAKRLSLFHTGKTAVEKTIPLAEKAKVVAVSVGQTTLHYEEERAAKAKDMTLKGGKTTATYASDVAMKAKDMTQGSGKTAAACAGDVAVDLKDKVTVVGWTAVQYTTEAAVEGTIKAAKVVMKVAEDAGHKVVDIVSKPLGMAKDAAVVAEEKAEEYTARKREEAQKELEAKRSAVKQNKQQLKILVKPIASGRGWCGEAGSSHGDFYLRLVRRQKTCSSAELSGGQEQKWKSSSADEPKQRNTKEGPRD
ncbi:hypothetical protein ACFX13_047791 [Malus domestica]